MRRLIAFWLMNAVAIGLAMSAASAHAAPSQAPAFTRYVADRLSHSVPEAGFAVKADLALEATGVDGARSHMISLARLYDFCERRRASCDDAIEQFLASTAEVMRETPRRRTPPKAPSPPPGHAT